MASLQAKDTYLQDLAKKICAQPGPERRRSEWGKAAHPSSLWEWMPSHGAAVLAWIRPLHA